MPATPQLTLALPVAPTLAPALAPAALPHAADWLDLQLPAGFGEAVDGDARNDATPAAVDTTLALAGSGK